MTNEEILQISSLALKRKMQHLRNVICVGRDRKVHRFVQTTDHSAGINSFTTDLFIAGGNAEMTEI